MKKSKLAKSSNLENGVDFISSMPDPILELILQGLPTTEEVVRTSVLSTQWRYLWTSIPYFPSLDIDVSRGPQNPKKLDKINEFISHVLANETVDLDSFRLRCDSYYTMLDVTEWIRAAITRKVKSLDLRFYPGPGYIVFPDCLVTCESLESLRLYLYGSRIKLPDCNGFSALKVLELNSVELPGFIEKCLEMCPSLEKLTLIDCVVKDHCYILEISCPKLKTLIIHNHKGPPIPIGLDVSCPELVFFECVGLQIKALFILKKVESLKTAVILPQINALLPNDLFATWLEYLMWNLCRSTVVYVMGATGISCHRV